MPTRERKNCTMRSDDNEWMICSLQGYVSLMWRGASKVLTFFPFESIKKLLSMKMRDRESVADEKINVGAVSEQTLKLFFVCINTSKLSVPYLALIHFYIVRLCIIIYKMHIKPHYIWISPVLQMWKHHFSIIFHTPVHGVNQRSSN